MSNRFLNNHRVKRVQISKILRTTAGRLHCWCDSNVGVIKKQNSKVDISQITVNKINANTIRVKKALAYNLKKEKPKLKWYQRFWNWLRSLFI